MVMGKSLMGRGECCGNPLRGCEHCPPPKKLTFEDWYQHYLIDFDGKHPSAAIVWQAAQENK